MTIDQSVSDIRSSSRLLVRELNFLKGSFNDSGFSYTQCHILFELDKHKMLNLMELSEILRLDKSTTSRVIKRLIQKGLVRVSKNENDHRQKLFSLTQAGSEATRSNNVKASEQVQNAIELLQPEEREMVLHGLSLYAKTLGQSRKQKQYTIRRIQSEDNLKVSSIIRKTMTEYEVTGVGSSIHDSEVDAMFEAYNNDRSAFFVISRGEEVLGCGGIGPLKGEEKTICELRKMYFLPELRGLGLGKKLVLQCLEAARKLGYQKCYLETVDRMWQANLLYQKMGFEKLDRQIGCTGHSACDTTYIRSL